MDEMVERHINQLLNSLSRDQMTACIAAMMQNRDGHSNMSRRDHEAALASFLRAHDMYVNMPFARDMLGMCKGDVAMAYLHLGRFREAIAFAEDALPYLREDDSLKSLLLVAHRTLGRCHDALGNTQESASNLRRAQHLLLELPATSQGIARTFMGSDAPRQESPRKWWKLWRKE